MNKKLSDLSLEELWELFPIFLVKHDDNWENIFKKEKENLFKMINMDGIKIYHIGSTSIKNIYAKPIIDILIEIPPNILIEKINDILVNNNYICMSKKPLRISLNKGYTINGYEKEVFHIHLRYDGDNDELYFRDYLNENSNIALEYESLKLSLAKIYKHNRDEYTNKKSDFVVKYTNIAKEMYGKRY